MHEQMNFSYLTLSYEPLRSFQDASSVSDLRLILVHTIHSEKIALVKFLCFLAFSLGRKIKIRND